MWRPTILVSLVCSLPPPTVGLDYSFDEDSLEVQFSSGETQKEVTLLIKDDSVLEESENFFLTLDVGPGATSDSNSFANVTITDDDEVRVQLTSEACSLTVTEDVGSLEISITRTGLSSIPVEVSVLILNGTAFGIYIHCKPKPHHKQ